PAHGADEVGRGRRYGERGGADLALGIGEASFLLFGGQRLVRHTRGQGIGRHEGSPRKRGARSGGQTGRASFPGSSLPGGGGGGGTTPAFSWDSNAISS